MRYLLHKGVALVRSILARPLLLFVLWALWLSSEYWILGDLSYIRVHDTADSHMPLIMWLTESVARNFGSALSPMGGGADRLASCYWFTNFQLVFLALPDWLAHGVITFAQRFVASFFMYRFCSDGLRMSYSTSVMAGAFYAMAHTDLGEVCYMHQLNEPGVPCLLWFFSRVRLDRGVRALGASVVLALTLGWSMLFVIGIAFIVPSAFLFSLLIREDLSSRKQVLTLIACFALFSVISLLPHIPAIWAMAVNSEFSHRAGWNTGGAVVSWLAMGMERARFLGAWWPATILIAVWLLMNKRRDRRSVAVITMLAVTVLGGHLLGGVATLLGPRLGFLNGFNFTRFDMLAPAFMICGACLGVDVFSTWRVDIRGGNRNTHAKLTLASVVAILLSTAALAHSIELKNAHWWKLRYEGANWRSLFGNREVVELAESIKGRPVRAVTAGANHQLPAAAPLALGIEIADGYVQMYPRTYHNYWSSIIRPLADRDAEVAGIHSWGSRIYLHHARSAPEIWRATVPFAEWYDLDLLSLANVRYILSEKPVDDSRLNLLGQQDRAQVEEMWGQRTSWNKVMGYLRGENPGKRMYIYENPAALDRVFHVRKVGVYSGEEELRSALEAAPIEHLRETLLVTGAEELPPLLGDVTDGAAAHIETLSYDIERIVVKVRSENDGYIVVTNPHYPWWQCTVDGVERDVFRAYGTFLGVYVPKGERKVVFAYAPPYKKLLCSAER